jgi:hypothetical protein
MLARLRTNFPKGPACVFCGRALWFTGRDTDKRRSVEQRGHLLETTRTMSTNTHTRGPRHFCVSTPLAVRALRVREHFLRNRVGAGQKELRRELQKYGSAYEYSNTVRAIRSLTGKSPWDDCKKGKNFTTLNINVTNLIAWLAFVQRRILVASPAAFLFFMAQCTLDLQGNKNLLCGTSPGTQVKVGVHIANTRVFDAFTSIILDNCIAANLTEFAGRAKEAVICACGLNSRKFLGAR